MFNKIFITKIFETSFIFKVFPSHRESYRLLSGCFISIPSHFVCYYVLARNMMNMYDKYENIQQQCEAAISRLNSKLCELKRSHNNKHIIKYHRSDNNKPALNSKTKSKLKMDIDDNQNMYMNINMDMNYVESNLK